MCWEKKGKDTGESGAVRPKLCIVKLSYENLLLCRLIKIKNMLGIVTYTYHLSIAELETD